MMQRGKGCWNVNVNDVFSSTALPLIARTSVRRSSREEGGHSSPTTVVVMMRPLPVQVRISPGQFPPSLSSTGLSSAAGLRRAGNVASATAAVTSTRLTCDQGRREGPSPGLVPPPVRRHPPQNHLSPPRARDFGSWLPAKPLQPPTPTLTLPPRPPPPLPPPPPH